MCNGIMYVMNHLHNIEINVFWRQIIQFSWAKHFKSLIAKIILENSPDPVILVAVPSITRHQVSTSAADKVTLSPSNPEGRSKLHAFANSEGPAVRQVFHVVARVTKF